MSLLSSIGIAHPRQERDRFGRVPRNPIPQRSLSVRGRRALTLSTACPLTTSTVCTVRFPFLYENYSCSCVRPPEGYRPCLAVAKHTISRKCCYTCCRFTCVPLSHSNTSLVLMCCYTILLFYSELRHLSTLKQVVIKKTSDEDSNTLRPLLRSLEVSAGYFPQTFGKHRSFCE